MWGRTILITLGLWLGLCGFAGLAHGDDEVSEIRGRFVVTVEGKKINGSQWKEEIEKVTLIRFGRNFLSVKTDSSARSFKQSDIDAIYWESIPEKPKTAAEIEEAFDELFDEIESMIEDNYYEGLIERFEKLNQLQKAYAALPKSAKPKVAHCQKGCTIRSDDESFTVLKVALRLQVYVNEGNAILRQMANSLESGKVRDLGVGFVMMKMLCARMKAEKNEDFDRNAEALYTKAKELRDNALKKQEK